MDYVSSQTRKYPAYTLAQLEGFVAEGKGTPVMVQEIADRKSGKSIHRPTPQVNGGVPAFRVGRM